MVETIKSVSSVTVRSRKVNKITRSTRIGNSVYIRNRTNQNFHKLALKKQQQSLINLPCFEHIKHTIFTLILFCMYIPTLNYTYT